jgi:hypothetical protein
MFMFRGKIRAKSIKLIKSDNVLGRVCILIGEVVLLSDDKSFDNRDEVRRVLNLTIDNKGDDYDIFVCF